MGTSTATYKLVELLCTNGGWLAVVNRGDAKAQAQKFKPQDIFLLN